MRPSLLLTPSLLALCAATGCQPSLVDVEYDKKAPLYGSDDDPAGSTGSGGDDGGGDVDPDDPIAGDFMLAQESSGGFLGEVSCEAWWNVTGEPASTDCPDCGFTLDWAYEMTYSLDPDALSLPAGCEYTTPGYFASLGSYGDQLIAMYLGIWAYSSDASSGGELFMGYDYYGYQGWRPLMGAEVTVSGASLQWSYVQSTTYSGYGYYDEYSVTQTWVGVATGQ